jgi:signal transduction histidine kinase/CheY-like chemotaxis protein
MNPVSDDSIDWLTGLGLVVVEERPDGSARSLGIGRAGVSDDIATAITRALDLPTPDPRVSALVREARTLGTAHAEVSGAKVGLARRSDRSLRAVIVPVDRTAASVIHEVANALTGIAGWSRLVATLGPVPDRTRSALEVLDRASSDALDTAQSLLASLQGHVEVGEGCDVADVVGAAIAMLRPVAQDKGIAIRVRLPAGLRASARPAELRSIATNLVKNAIEALEPGGEIVVFAEREEGRLVLTILDDGPGIDEDALASVFEPWVSKKRGGTGLGLALVRDLARGRGGDVRAESARGGGARFTVRLPLLADVGTPEGRKVPRAASGVRRRSQSMRRALRVLVVDDDEPVRTMVATALGLRGMAVSTCAGVHEVAQLGTAEKFDVAIVDLTLGDGRGDQLAGWMREHGLASRIILASGVPGAQASTVDAVLRKPFAIDELIEVIERLAVAKARTR